VQCGDGTAGWLDELLLLSELRLEQMKDEVGLAEDPDMELDICTGWRTLWCGGRGARALHAHRLQEEEGCRRRCTARPG
jgi:hypothetical protein